MKKIIALLGQNENEDHPVSGGSQNVSPHVNFIGHSLHVGSYHLVVEDVIAEGKYIEIKLTLKSGGFGVVFRVKSNKGEHFALKRMCVNNQQDLAVIKREITIVVSFILPFLFQSSLSHKNIIRFVDSKITETQRGIFEILMVTAFYRVSLIHIVKDKRSKNLKFSEEDVLKVLCDMIEAVSRLHHCQTPIIHRDLKIENILLDSNGNYVLCDFGSATSRVLCPSVHGHQRCQDELSRYTTVTYCAPEMVDLYANNGNVMLGPQTDIWSLGVLTYSLCFFSFPFGDSSPLAIQSGNYTIPNVSPYSDKMHKLINYMLTYDWQKRPDIYQIACLAFSMMARNVPIENLNSADEPRWEDLSLPYTEEQWEVIKRSRHEADAAAKKFAAESNPRRSDQPVMGVRAKSPANLPRPQGALKTSISPRERPRPQAAQLISSLAPPGPGPMPSGSAATGESSVRPLLPPVRSPGTERKQPPEESTTPKPSDFLQADFSSAKNSNVPEDHNAQLQNDPWDSQTSDSQAALENNALDWEANFDNFYPVRKNSKPPTPSDSQNFQVSKATPQKLVSQSLNFHHQQLGHRRLVSDTSLMHSSPGDLRTSNSMNNVENGAQLTHSPLVQSTMMKNTATNSSSSSYAADLQGIAIKPPMPRDDSEFGAAFDAIRNG